jgi:repressor LexA
MLTGSQQRRIISNRKGVLSLSTIGSRIRNRREELGLSQDELGKRLGYKSRSSINKIELDQRNLTQSKIKAIADALETTPSYIMGWDEPDQKFDEEKLKFFDNLFPITVQKIPLLGNIACGKPIFADEQFEAYVEAGANIKADFCLRAKGDSMIGARIQDGDIVFIHKQEMVDDGEIAAVLIDDEATLKRVYYDQENSILQLFAENPQYKTMRFAGEELNHIRILGKAVAFQSDVK